MNEMEASCSFKFRFGSACSYYRRDRGKSFEVVPLVSCNKGHKVLGFLPELRTRVNLSLPEQVLFT